MKNNINKKLLVFLTFIFCFYPAFAETGQQLLNKIGRTPVKQAKPKGEMRIFVKEGEEVITNFETAYLTASPKIHIILPDGTWQERVPSVYIISPEEIDREKLKEKFPTNYNNYLFVTVRSDGEETNFTPFLTHELLPYIEVNYFVSSNATDRTLIVKNSFAINYLTNLEEISEYLQNVVLGFDYSSPLPEIKAQKGLNLLAYGPLEEMASLHASLAKNGLVYLQDFAYNIAEKAPLVTPENLDFLFNKEGRKIIKMTPYQQFKTLDLSKDINSAFWLNLTAKNGYNLAYVPQNFRIAPPLLNWDKEQGVFEIISGAAAGKVKVSGKTEFGKNFKAQFTLIDSANQPQKAAKNGKNK